MKNHDFDRDGALLCAISLLQRGLLEQQHINEIATNEELPATWYDDPVFGIIAEIASNQPSPLCEALFLLLDGWFHYQREKQGYGEVASTQSFTHTTVLLQ
jgi:hypothetical protein